ncbi:MAG TPA: MFS transporter [Verrucomicrobiae bacterium]|nr:MFS transporter [Verrucomicrobiae bacterium]
MSTDAQHKTRTLWLLGMLHAFTHIYNVALLPLYLLIKRDFGFAGEGQATSLVTVLMLSYFVPSYWLGILADRVSRKKLLSYGLALNGIGFVALAFAPNYCCALTACVIAGIGGSFYHPAATAMIARLFPVRTGRAFGLVGIGAGVGFFLGPIYAGWRAGMLEAARGAAAWREPVLELGILGILGAIVFACLADKEKSPSPTERQPKHADKLFPAPALYLFFFAAAFAFGLRDFVGASMGSLGSLFLQKAQGYDASYTGKALSGLFLAAAVGNPLFGKLSDGGRKRWTAMVLTISAVLVLIFPRVPKDWAIPVLLVYGFFFMASYPMIEAALMESVPDSVRGRIYGMFITVGGIVGQISHWIVGEIVKRMGDAAHQPENYFPLYGVLAGMLILTLLGLPCLHAIRLREHVKPEHRNALNPYVVPTE